MRTHRIAMLVLIAVSTAIVPLAGTAGCAGRLRMPALDAGGLTGYPPWAPRPGLRWRIQLNGPLADGGDANVYDLDPFTTSAQTVADLHAKGRRTICHLDAGISDMTLPDAHRLAATTLGGSAGEGRRWLDIRRWNDLEPVLSDRFRLCRDKGFDAVDADATSGYVYRTGFPLTEADQIAFDRNVAALAHRLDLAVGVRTRPDLAAAVEPYTDFTVTGGCFTDPDCVAFSVFISAGKAVFDVETALPAADFCPLARAYGFAAISATEALDGFVRPC